MVSKVQIRSQFDLMNELTSLLIDELRVCEYSKAEYYQLPDINSVDENIIPESIPVKKLTGEIAHRAILNSFTDIYKKESLSSRVLKRHPGLLVLKNADVLALTSRIQQVNKAKAAFKECVLAIDNNDARFEAVHNAVPNLITLAAYRKIYFQSESPFSVRFTWMHKHATKTLTKKMALEMLDKSAGYRNPRMIDQQKWQSLVAQEQMRVASLGEKEKLRIRRPTRVSPQVNVRYTAENRYHVSAALPFILINPQPDVKLGTLPDYQKPESHPRKKEYDFLVDRLYLEQVDK
ncbi:MULTISPECIES: DNA replication terminus site-binding protein [unclassified Pseudoalteromonas]|uniref:DNA replication terminus site-binding protein n=1 Tax=unclassified Pseudoalteromonas TaxID=194690 RepID=UPI002359ACF7|nr:MULTISPECIES: DNA replication terminus site-binding protein [unclassified Pseudoalteromonas]MDC9564021.1 DNA replication terminus site-binding protein [Pseudoalteromonas sp. GAB2316C]MDC9567937.1 DNA replication terminus site-binding protein [Pseudoalteromonas sp. GABNB9D]MDC9572199.1 DNA replication terminus site-binding protein [Pseudoalteromonas sp. GABNS16A]MDC9578558.1 DNA replication terminus site-binding protein [Pseudoalteromonas sp. GABNS16E]MDC9586854.1 DNA replication terminus si|tara:strand:+ start:81 stop:956 length:876 start_codon:yes stop_codon:yes gene_type:complete